MSIKPYVHKALTMDMTLGYWDICWVSEGSAW